jgi:hypothetical protein
MTPEELLRKLKLIWLKYNDNDKKSLELIQKVKTEWENKAYDKGYEDYRLYHEET